jgi:hypothetical protein
MESIIIGTLVVVLLSVFYSDRNFRLVYLWQLLLVFGFSLSISMMQWGWKISGLIVMNNVLFSALLLLLTFLFLRLRKGELPFWDHAFGKGDLLFFLSIAPLFLPQVFMAFVLLGLLTGLSIGWMQKTKQAGVPLAGIMALLLCVVLLFEFVLNTSIRFTTYTFAGL